MDEKLLLLFATLSAITTNWNIAIASSVPLFRKDYVFNSETQNFYKIHSVKKNWFDSQKRCMLEGAQLFVPESQLDRDVARDLIVAKFPMNQDLPVYIDLHDMFLEREFVTIGGKSVDSFFIEWDESEPSNTDDENCVALKSNGKMNDLKCNTELPFMCKKSQSSIKWNSFCEIPDVNYLYDKAQEKCYKLHSTPKTWNQAYSICAAELSYLAIINSQSEADHLIRLVKEGPEIKQTQPGFTASEIHLGFHELSEGEWITINGEALIDAGYNRWAPGMPDNWKDDESCGAMFLDGALNDESCKNVTSIFICEHDIDSKSFSFSETDSNCNTTVN